MKPPAIRIGATIGIVSPASTPRLELVERGIDVLTSLGYKTKLFPHAIHRGPLYYAGSTQDRVADLHRAFSDPEVHAILCTRGGWGSAELLPWLDRDLIQAHPKLFLGYSDQTSLHLWLRHEVNLVTLHAPMLAADFARPDGVELESWHAMTGGATAWQAGKAEGLRTLKPGIAQGELHGGCLALYVESLGTPYSARARQGVLFLEDINVKPFQWDRMIVHLKHAGLLADVSGIVFGDMSQSGSREDQPAIEASLLHALRDFEGPVAIGLRSGHVDRANITLPLGVEVRLDLTNEANPQLHFLEAAVRS